MIKRDGPRLKYVRLSNRKRARGKLTIVSSRDSRRRATPAEVQAVSAKLSA